MRISAFTPVCKFSNISRQNKINISKSLLVLEINVGFTKMRPTQLPIIHRVSTKCALQHTPRLLGYVSGKIWQQELFGTHPEGEHCPPITYMARLFYQAVWRGSVQNSISICFIETA